MSDPVRRDVDLDRDAAAAGATRHSSLTIEARASTIEFMQSWTRAFLGALVLVTFSGSVWATCLEGAAVSTQQQMACCKDGEFTCTPAANAGDCCTTGTTRSHDALAIAKIEPVHALIAVVATWAVLRDATLTLPDPAHAGAGAAPPPIQQGPPPYIAYSSLLI